MRYALIANPLARSAGSFHARAGRVATYATRRDADKAAAVLRRHGVRGVQVIELPPVSPPPAKDRPVKEYVVDGVRHTVPIAPWRI